MTDESATRITEMSKEARFLLDRTVCGDVPVCPFCGTASVSVRTPDKGGFAVMCNGCPTTTEHGYDTIEEAWCAWVDSTEKSKRMLETFKHTYLEICAIVSGRTPEEIEAELKKMAGIAKRDSEAKE